MVHRRIRPFNTRETYPEQPEGVKKMVPHGGLVHLQPIR